MSGAEQFPPYDGSIDIDLWKWQRKRDLKIAAAKESKLLTHTDSFGAPLYKLTPAGNHLRAKPLSASARGAVIKRDKDACVQCGGPGPFEVDHIVRYVDGGSNDPTNLQTLCVDCHRRKGGR